ncbi:MAG: hypothetical protein ABI807_04410 [Sporichthyaceae bacterium]
MSESFSEPSGTSSTETDVGESTDPVEPDGESGYVGRIAGDDVGYAGEQGAEARAAADDIGSDDS